MPKTSENTEVVFAELKKELALDKIDIGDENVRKTEVTAELEGLEQSIDQVGVIQPILVVPSGERYRLISGQRRYYACKRLGLKTIPALIIGSARPDVLSLISFGENVHRRELPYTDTVRVVTELFDHYPGSQKIRVEKVSRVTGLSPERVVYYLGHRFVPDEVKQLVETKQLSRDQALALTEAFFDQPQKIAAIAKETPRLTKPEKQRVVEISKRTPKASPTAILEEARKLPQPQVRLTLWIDKETHQKLVILARTRNFSDVSELVKSLLDDFVKGRLRP